MAYRHKFDLDKIETHLLENELEIEETEYSIDELKGIYIDMLTIRKMEEVADSLFQKGLIRGFCHLVNGQESIYAAYKLATNQKDTSTSSYRCHGLSYVNGDEPKNILAELLGRKDGVCKGKGGSMHLYNERFFGGHGIVGASVPIGVGLAFKHKYVHLKKGDPLDKVCAKEVSFAFYGDGAANQGQIFEVYNMAGRWKLPVVFVCENNEYGMWTKVERVSLQTQFYKRGVHMPGIRISHDNIFDLISAMKFCRKYVLSKQPIILEIKTYRLCTHSARDGEDFRNGSELKKKEENDVLLKYRVFLGEFLSEKEILELEEKVTNEIQKAKEFALQSEEPPAEELYTDIIIE